jgi:hypothetical protein
MTDAERTAYYDANPTSCQARHPTETDVSLATDARNNPKTGPDGKNVINRHPLKCWHGHGHEGRHGYGSVTWPASPTVAARSDAK